MNVSRFVASGLLLILSTPIVVQAQEVKFGTSAIWGVIDGVSIEGMVKGPSAEITPLQVACIFEYTEGDIFKSPPALPATENGMVHLDEALNGIITAVDTGSW